MGTQSPRWFGFNLPEMFLGPGDMRFSEMIRNPHGRFSRVDLQLISELGFNYVRLPLCYRWWASNSMPCGFNDAGLKPVDEAIEACERLGLHVTVAMHHAPGFCINPPPTPEPGCLWTDNEPRERFIAHWSMLADRYAGISPRTLSFDLINEPAGCSEQAYARVARAAFDAIRARTPERTVISNGIDAGNKPCPSLADTAMVQSCRGYMPSGLTHYLAWWAGMSYTKPDWPMPMDDGRVFDEQDLWQAFAEWRTLLQAGVPVHCGEFGCHHRTQHHVMLQWCEALLDAFDRMGIGWAMWNFRGSFGIIDSSRSDVAYQTFRGERLDGELLKLLQRFRKS